MKKLFVSLPMKGRTEEAIKASIIKMKKIAEAYEGEELALIDSYIDDKPPANYNQSVWYLSKSLEKLSEADIFIGISDTKGWAGCQIEADVARLYNIKRYRVDNSIVVDYEAMVQRVINNIMDSYNTSNERIV